MRAVGRVILRDYGEKSWGDIDVFFGVESRSKGEEVCDVPCVLCCLVLT